MRRTIKTKDGSTQSAEVPMHHIMRSAAEKIHDAIEEFTNNRESTRNVNAAITTAELLELYKLVITVSDEALKSILDLTYDYDDSPKAKWESLSG